MSQLLSEAIKCNFQREKGVEVLVSSIPSEFFISLSRIFPSRLGARLAYGPVKSFPKHSVQLQTQALLVFPV